jgi:hypothetical protein
MKKDDQQWVALLGGEDVPDAPDAIRADAARTRAVLEEAREEQVALSDAAGVDVAAGWARLAAKATSEGLMSATEVRGGAGEPRRRVGKLWASLSAVAVGVAALLAVFLPPVMVGTRGGGETLPAVIVDNPAQTANALAEDLRGVGVKTTIELPGEPPGSARVVVEVPGILHDGDPVDQVLERYRIPATTSSSFTIQFQKR